jgi:hypothetical protein
LILSDVDPHGLCARIRLCSANRKIVEVAQNTQP